jgi:hypothetical protein
MMRMERYYQGLINNDISVPQCLRKKASRLMFKLVVAVT